jgi:hypothetical protein
MKLLLAGALAGALAAPAVPAQAAGAPSVPAFAIPASPRALARSTTYAELASFLRSVDGKGPVSVSVEGKSREGRDLFVVRIARGSAPRWRVLFYAQQHGDEVSGKDALLYLVRDAVRAPETFPEDVELRILPMVNPDGAEARTRRNGAKADLNRDHVTLEEPETQALHRVFRSFRPHLAVDAHEFTRDPEEWRARGIQKWTDITMDGLCNPLFAPELVSASLRHLGEAAAAEAKAGHRFLRYWVGGVPPLDEQRHSAPDLDGGLNAAGAYGALSFIIEAAVTRAAGTPDADLGSRVDAYLVLFRRFLSKEARPDADFAAIERARARPLSAFLPTNYFWGNPGPAVVEFPVLDLATGAERTIATPNLMSTMVVKRSVPTPRAYAILPEAAAAFRELLGRHGLPFEELRTATGATVERATLLRVEEAFDDLYGRYEGRQVVAVAPASKAELPAGSLLVALEGADAMRAALLLEPSALYGLYQYPRYRALVGKDRAIPVVRVVGER